MEPSPTTLATPWSLIGAVVGAMLGLSFVGDFARSLHSPLVVIGAGGGAVIGFTIPVMIRAQRIREERERLAREAAEREAEAKRRAERLQELRRIITKLTHDAQKAALSLPIILADAELSLDEAEAELVDHRYVLFWEAIELTIAHLDNFGRTVDTIKALHLQHTQISVEIGNHVPPLDLGISTFPDPQPTQDRLVLIYRLAHQDPDFAGIYEQRRTTSKLHETNAILSAGFTSLNQALTNLGTRICEAISQLAQQMGHRLGSISEALENASTAAADQRRELIGELRGARSQGADFVREMEKEAADRERYLTDIRSMLDNIQRRRRPGHPW